MEGTPVAVFDLHFPVQSVTVCQALFGLKKLGNQEGFSLKIRRLSGIFLYE